MPKNTPIIGFFGFYEKFSSLVCKCFGFKSWTKIVFKILRKLHGLEKSGSQAIHLLANQIARFFPLEYLLNYMRYQVNFLYVVILYVFFLQFFFCRNKIWIKNWPWYYSLANTGMAVAVARHSQACLKCAEIKNFHISTII